MIGFLDMTTHKTALAGIAWVNQNHLNPCHLRFVSEEGAQLGERPIAVPSALLLTSSPSPRTNARQIFQGYRTLRALGSCNDTLAHNVVGIALKTALSAGQLAQVALGRQRAVSLQSRAKALMALARALYRLAGVDRPVRISGDVGHAQVNAQGGVYLGFIRIGNVADGQQVKLAFAVDQIGFAFLG